VNERQEIRRATEAAIGAKVAYWRLEAETPAGQWRVLSGDASDRQMALEDEIAMLKRYAATIEAGLR